VRTPYLQRSGPVRGPKDRRVQVDLDELMDQHRLFGGPPLSGKELAKVMSLGTPHELEAFARQHGTGRIQDLVEKFWEPPEDGQSDEPPGPKQIIFGQGDKPQPMSRLRSTPHPRGMARES
jgi:hypothetical protein